MYDNMIFAIFYYTNNYVYSLFYTLNFELIKDFIIKTINIYEYVEET